MLSPCMPMCGGGGEQTFVSFRETRRNSASRDATMLKAKDTDTKSPSSALLSPFFFWEGSPTKIDQRRKQMVPLF